MPPSKPRIETLARAHGQPGLDRPTRPAAYGGGGLSADENKILQQELGRIQARPALNSFGLWMLGRRSSSSLRKSKSKPICRRSSGEKFAGARATPNRVRAPILPDCKPAPKTKGTWIVNGAKIWTSYANHADWIFCLVRTEPDAPKHEGMLPALDMASEGVSTSPIKLFPEPPPLPNLL